MTRSPVPDLQHPWPLADAPSATPDQWMTELGTLLDQLDGAPGALPKLPGEAPGEQLVQPRLGIASSLFAALQCKHATTAGHALRVALNCSAWAGQMGLKDPQRDFIEIAALLHDIGIIGVPDRVLMKPEGLDGDETALFLQARAMGQEILRRSCASPEILQITGNVAAWYDGSRGESTLRGDQLPLGSRMIAIAEAFDAMTTDRVYRAAMSQERATAELFQYAGRQFDPQLVKQFAEFQEADTAELRRATAARWLHTLDPGLVDSHWHVEDAAAAPARASVDHLFQAKLLDNMYDAVVFIDAAGRVALWNHGAERLTGISSSSLAQRQWRPELLCMADEKGRPVPESDCPVLCAIRTGVQSLRRLTIWGRTGRSISVDTHTIPVIAEDGSTQGAVLLLHDASSEISLEQRCQSLHEKATRDPLTQVANRAEFDRVHAMFVAAHQQQKVPCSLLMCDLDKFKTVNDTYGHQAGDEAIQSLAALLKGACHPGDLVARYGGEEFVMLCADCDNAAGTRRAEQVRKALSHMPQGKMGGRSITVSFGVTEIQPGDTPETMLRRADRALLTAKSKGRNMVVQLGSGSSATEEPPPKRSFWPFGGADAKELLQQQTLLTPVPLQMAVEKLRGFVADHEATVIHADAEQVQLEINDQPPSRFRRLTDRPVTFQLDVRFEENRMPRAEGEQGSGGVARTRIRVMISLKRSRDRRRADAGERARLVLASFRSYLMAVPDEEEPEPPAAAPAKRGLPWLGRK